MNTKKTALVWFRRDLRLADNPALSAALSSYEIIIPIFIYAPHEERPWSPGAASNWWLHNSLVSLQQDLLAIGSNLFIAEGDSMPVLQGLLKTYKASAIFWNRVYEPTFIERDRQIKKKLTENGIECRSFNASLINEPTAIQTKAGTPYKVFTAYWKNAQSTAYDFTAPLSSPTAINSGDKFDKHASIPQLNLLDNNQWHKRFHDYWTPGELGAHQRLNELIEHVLHEYNITRDIPSEKGTSKLSSHLHFGEISPKQIIWSIINSHDTAPEIQPHLTRYITELGWRDFSAYILFHFPESCNHSLDKRFDHGMWLNSESQHAALLAWKEGRTGIPLIDAGMNELWKTGWMHNRVRMVVASFLTKNIGLHWLEGARWFWDTLVDADLAANSLGWQWTAGCGVDAAPYFRVFSPIRQNERFDPQDIYINRWTTPSKKVLPIIDMKTSRQEALTRWKNIDQFKQW